MITYAEFKSRLACCSTPEQVEAVYAAYESATPTSDAPPVSALDVQVGGGHYKDMKIQPVEFIHANGLGFLEGCVVKRICRWRNKDGIKDLEKIKHEVDLLIALEKEKGNG